MPTPPPPGRAEILDWLTGFAQRPPDAERLDSMELAWLAHQVEQRYGLELTDAQLDRIRTIDLAVAVLREALPGGPEQQEPDVEGVVGHG